MLKEHGSGYLQLIKHQKANSKCLKHTLMNVLKSIPELPVFREKKERLAVFAAQITGNPHFYDAGTLAEQLLIQFIRFYFSIELSEWKTGVEQKNAIFYKAGILRDDISNYIIVYGIRGNDEHGQLHSGMEGFVQRKEPMILTLFTVGRLQDIWSENENIYVVENPAVFSWLCETYPEESFICTNGQLHFCAYLLLDQIIKHNRLYYAGDFDPEGLAIAQNIMKRYGKQAKLWNYRPEYYECYLSQVKLREERITQLEKINLEELQEIKNMMKEKKLAAYQENMLEIYQPIQSSK